MWFGLLPFIILAVCSGSFSSGRSRWPAKGALSFGKSKAKILAKDRNKTNFQGCCRRRGSHGGSFELVRVSSKDPKNSSASGGRIPRVPMIGPPGTERRCSPGDRRRGGCRFFSIAVLTLLKCLSVSAPVACGICLSRRAKKHALV